MIKVNEQFLQYDENTSLLNLRDAIKPNADIIIYNGFPVPIDQSVHDGDEIVFIKRGEIPSQEELETLMVSRHSPGVHERVKKSVVGIAGQGGLGSAVAIALARLGIGTLVLADFDIVEPSNLNRQQYFVHQIGQTKVQAIEENIRMINPYVHTEIHHIKLDEKNVPQVFKDVDILVEAFDRPEMKGMLVNSFFEHFPDRYMVCASGLAGYGDANLIQSQVFGERLYIVGDRHSAASPGQGLMSPRVGVVAHHQANKVLQIILGENQ